MKKRLAIWVIALSLGIFTVQPRIATAFGTIGILGQHFEHQRITRLAMKGERLSAETLDQLAGTKFSFGAVGAPDWPMNGLIDVKAAHCDGGDFLATQGYAQTAAAARANLESCRDWIFQHLMRAVDAAAAVNPSGLTRRPCKLNSSAGPGRCRVLYELGLALHATQDFYAHTNWVDHPAPGALTALNPPGLGHSSPAPFIDWEMPAAFPAGLISGCYEGFPEALYCGHGKASARVAHSVLNKDDGVINVTTGAISQGETPRGKINGNFERAVGAAVADTKKKWSGFSAKLVKKYGAARASDIVAAL